VKLLLLSIGDFVHVRMKYTSKARVTPMQGVLTKKWDDRYSLISTMISYQMIRGFDTNLALLDTAAPLSDSVNLLFCL